MSAVQKQQTTANGTSSDTSPETRKVATQEVGWLFAKEYYKFMNSDPERLYHFYGKKSISIHGDEGQSVFQANGQQEIRGAINQGEFKGRKVLVTNVDALPSISASIIVQVIGQMDTKDGLSYLRFVHTFLLAEQQGGYYIHNDILRYLNEDNEEREAGIEEALELAAPAAENIKKDEKVDADDDLKKDTAPVAAESDSAKVNSTVSSAAETSVPAAEVKAAVAEAIADNITTATPVADAPKSETKAKASKDKPSSTNASAAAPDAVSEAPSSAAKAPKPDEKPTAAATAASTSASTSAPAKPTTWANLAAVNQNKWNNDTIAKVDGTVARVSAPSSLNASANAISNTASTDAPSRVSTPGSGARDSRRIKNDALAVFVKNIPIGTTITQMKAGFKSFGPITFVDYAQQRTNGVVEFTTEAGKLAALRAGSTTVNGTTVAIEERRNRQPSNARRDGNTGRQASPQGANTPARNGSGDFERVGSRGPRGRAPTASSASNAGGNGNSANRARGGKQ
ncbi:hypothetical protein J3B02_001180 [Coemansia erecta]|uniref:NTF2 domain-containing protein n=1 Tax=Coemansia asiatica TaxID=1052880 RepID=A0A9W8CHC5_9FUNG|nr:hypothetical protein LPJ64_004379 [Coemansia asiatica]KAJ2857164.1 hypothetical protein J3B02_001180 [Coemansia erecta]KAJ2888360.1 hypothetical protein FB639_000691 [Coemansia asiatica]